MAFPNDFNDRCKMLDYMLAGLESDMDNLTQWENDFVISIREQYDKNKKRKYTLSDRQCEIIENIYNKHF